MTVEILRTVKGLVNKAIKFGESDSILLIGARGSGKSTVRNMMRMFSK